MGSPGWPDFACSTASIASARIAFAMRSWSARGTGDASCPADIEAAVLAVAAARGDIPGSSQGVKGFCEPLARGPGESKNRPWRLHFHAQGRGETATKD